SFDSFRAWLWASSSPTAAGCSVGADESAWPPRYTPRSMMCWRGPRYLTCSGPTRLRRRHRDVYHFEGSAIEQFFGDFEIVNLERGKQDHASLSRHSLS